MEKIGTYFSPEETKTYAVVEGDISIATGISVLTGKRDEYLAFENEVIPETFLEFAGVVDEKYGLQCMQPAETEATHICMYDPEWEGGFRPTEAVEDGDYDRRQVACSELYANKEYRLPLSATNKAISVNDELELVSATGGLDKASSTTGVFALEAKAANEGGEIFVRLAEPKIPVASP